MHKKEDLYECGGLVRVCKYQICVWYQQVELQVKGTEMYKTDSYECGRLVDEEISPWPSLPQVHFMI
jgi:hypothetical protein